MIWFNSCIFDIFAINARGRTSDFVFRLQYIQIVWVTTYRRYMATTACTVLDYMRYVGELPAWAAVDEEICRSFLSPSIGGLNQGRILWIATCDFLPRFENHRITLVPGFPPFPVVSGTCREVCCFSRKLRTFSYSPERYNISLYCRFGGSHEISLEYSTGKCFHAINFVSK